MPTSKVIILSLFLSINYSAFCQVEHNFKMDPEKTDCHELELTGNVQQDLIKIKESTFRVKEEFKISRYHVPNKVDFYSCDGMNGILVATENDSTIKIIKDVKKSVWDSLTSTDDPIKYYKIKFIDEKN